MPPRYLYQRRGGPLVQWNRLRPPAQARAADARSLGSLGGSDVFGTPRRLPRGGAPEYIADGLSGTCGCKSGMGCSGTEHKAQGDYVAVGGLGAETASKPAGEIVMDVFDKAAPIAAVYHGYKRNESVLWALVWGVCGAASPLLTTVISVAQGYGKKK